MRTRLTGFFAALVNVRIAAPVVSGQALAATVGAGATGGSGNTGNGASGGNTFHIRKAIFKRNRFNG